MLSLALFIDKLEDVSDAVSASKPGVMFRPPDYPGVLITPEESTPNSTTGALAFGHGKSCLLRWPEEAGAVAIEMYLVDLVDASEQAAPRRARCLGCDADNYLVPREDRV